MEDLVVIPLRVSREQRRAWREIALREDKSVQRWILDKVNPVRGADPTKHAGNIDAQGRTGGATPPTGAKPKAPDIVWVPAVDEPEFKIINGRKFPTPLLGTLRDSSVMCYVCGEYCRSSVPWSKNVSGKEFVCQACWRKA